MTVARGIGKSGKVAMYEVPDTDLAVGSTLGGPKATTIIKANGAIEKVFSVEHGQVLFGTVILRHYDAATGIYLSQDQPGTFVLHPEHQEHRYSLSNHVAVHEDIFVLSGQPGDDGAVDPPGVYQTVQLRNDGDEPIDVVTYAYADLRGETSHDVKATYNKRLCAIVAWNESIPEQCRVFGCSRKPGSYETTLDSGKAVSERCPGRLSGKTVAECDPLGVMQHSTRIEPGKVCGWSYLLSFGDGREGATKNYRACPRAADALARTKEYYEDVLDRAVVLTPDSSLNEGVLWAKANMLRVQNRAETGWCFTNDPTRSNNSVARDTAWFAFGADYLTPDFSRESLLAYVDRQEKSGMIVEYYDIRTGTTEDYGLNINDNTPLLILALWHHYNLTEDIDFLNQVYPAAAKAARYILSQRNDQGLVWCTATGVSDWGIVGWRNVIPNYRLSGASTEVNSECYAALRTISQMARTLERHDESSTFSREAEALKEAVNTHLFNPDNGLYFLHIDLNGNARTDVTSDLVFPVIFGVASDRTAANIIQRLSNADFWTGAGMRTSPRDAPNYTPDGGWGLLGGVWVGVSFWYAFAAAKCSPQMMAHALSTSFQNYASDPRRNNTVPGQFSEWLHGETLVNQGMMLSPWFPPRYLWAAIEGVAGFDPSSGSIKVSPLLAPDWKWMAVQNLPFRGERLTWFTVRMSGDIVVHTNFVTQGETTPSVKYDTDITSFVRGTSDAACIVAFQQGTNLVICLGNTSERTVTTSVRVIDHRAGAYRLRTYNSMIPEWIEDEDLISADEIRHGQTVELEGKGFAMLKFCQEV
jgi:Bacterial alpha-L-rhamnosidase 6 hairpin glycosidase domain